MRKLNCGINIEIKLSFEEYKSCIYKKAGHRLKAIGFLQFFSGLEQKGGLIHHVLVKKILRLNNNAFMAKQLRKAIMRRSR